MHSFFNRSHLFDDLQSVLSISEWLAETGGELVVDSTVASLGYLEFFSQLEQFELLRAGKRTQSNNIQAKSLEILIPDSIQDCKQCACSIMDEIFGDDKALPYVAFLVTRGKGRYLRILISERYYSAEEIVYVDRWKSDRYQNKVTGRLCKAADPEAKKIVSAGDIRKTWISHFSLKSRMFSADGFARKQSNRKERIGFDRLLKHLRQCIVAAFVKLKVQFTKEFNIPKLKRHDWLNQYQNINLTRINNAIHHIENELQEEWIAVRDGYFIQNAKTYDRFMALAKRYLNRFKNGFFNKKVGGNRKLKLSFSPFMNVVRVQENLDSLIEDFDKEIDEFRMKYRYGI